MPHLIAPVFNSVTAEPVAIELDKPFVLVSGNHRLYEVTARYLRNEMNENRFFFDKKVSPNSLFLFAEYPRMKVTEDRPWIEEIEHKLNLAAEDGICSIPYVVTSEQPAYGITYLKRSLEGSPLVFQGRTRATFERLFRHKGQFPQLAYSRYMLSLEKESWEDRLLDLWIALESLFVPDGKKGEIMYKLRYRIAYYFADSFAQRQRLADFIKHSYNHRSEIVHSGKMMGSELKKEVRTLRKLARAALINLYLEGVNQQLLRTRLDELILSGQCYRERFQPEHFETVAI
ncbi:hypothetical protein G3578_14325 [Brevibacillus sp. SYP-B805]|uniref:HEPN domain-containing protein n=1 Tax=Brevibacillus sp. SYP-B805 TaxID=1578199 RepID=UPI0013EB94FC|nr:HEPN domain-containing protein [Brevibacillus sp. SYP-B805]NGQ96338.1 hypothetical protein [Brevibacillus sp. SYP-B805]